MACGDGMAHLVYSILDGVAQTLPDLPAVHTVDNAYSRLIQTRLVIVWHGQKGG